MPLIGPPTHLLCLRLPCKVHTCAQMVENKLEDLQKSSSMAGTCVASKKVPPRHLYIGKPKEKGALMQRHKMQVLACAREGGEDNAKLQQTRTIAIYFWPCLHFDMLL